jgi:ABC-2 type transport system ATP-binding protein
MFVQKFAGEGLAGKVFCMGENGVLSPIIKLAAITKTFGSVTALNNLSLEICPGATGLLGPNGSGKTTLIRTLLGLIKPDQGGGTVLGLDVRTRQLEIRRQIGFAPEDDTLFPGVHGIEFVAYAGELCGMPHADAMQRAHEVLDYVGLGEVRYRKVESYSSGMKQRLKLAAAIVHDPKLLIMDEPTNGMDPAGRDDILKLARDLSNNKGMSLIFSSHLLPDVEAICSRIVVLSCGKLLVSGEIGELKKVHPGRFDVRIKEPPTDFITHLTETGCTVELMGEMLRVEMPTGQGAQMLWRHATADGVQIRHLRPQRSTLEEVFLSAVEPH